MIADITLYLYLFQLFISLTEMEHREYELIYYKKPTLTSEYLLHSLQKKYGYTPDCLR